MNPPVRSDDPSSLQLGDGRLVCMFSRSNPGSAGTADSLRIHALPIECCGDINFRDSNNRVAAFPGRNSGRGIVAFNNLHLNVSPACQGLRSAAGGAQASLRHYIPQGAASLAQDR